MRLGILCNVGLASGRQDGKTGFTDEKWPAFEGVQNARTPQRLDTGRSNQQITTDSSKLGRLGTFRHRLVKLGEPTRVGNTPSTDSKSPLSILGGTKTPVSSILCVRRSRSDSGRRPAHVAISSVAVAVAVAVAVTHRAIEVYLGEDLRNGAEGFKQNTYPAAPNQLERTSTCGQLSSQFSKR